MDCYRCWVEGTRTAPRPATTAWQGTPVCAECADDLAGATSAA